MFYGKDWGKYLLEGADCDKIKIQTEMTGIQIPGGETMEIRTAGAEDLPALEALYASARDFMAAQGNPHQWGNDRPARELLEEDIRRKRSYICCEGDEVLGAFMFTTEEEPTYAVVEGGAWPDEGSYGVVHRIATGGGRRGAGEFCLRWCAQRCRQLRIDTHEDNRPMRSLLKKMGFHECGVIRLADGEPRLAFWLDETKEERN